LRVCFGGGGGASVESEGKGFFLSSCMFLPFWTKFYASRALS